MSYRKQFTTGEWETLQFAPLWVFTMVAAVDGKVEKKEAAALAQELGEALLYKSDLAKEVFLSVARNFSTVWPAYQRDSRDVVAGLHEAGALVDEKLSATEAELFKRSLLFLGGRILDSTSSGVFGKKDKSREKAALVLAAIALGVHPD